MHIAYLYESIFQYSIYLWLLNLQTFNFSTHFGGISVTFIDLVVRYMLGEKNDYLLLSNNLLYTFLSSHVGDEACITKVYHFRHVLSVIGPC